MVLPIGPARERTGPGPDRLGLKCYWLGGVGWGKGGGHTLSVFLEKQINVSIFDKYALLCFQTPFFPEKKPPEVLPTGLTQGFVYQHSCACTRFLCMHNTLVHAQHSCACTARARAQGQDPTKKRPRVRPGGGRYFVGSWPWALAPPVHAQECCACTRVLCMHKNLVHAQEC